MKPANKQATALRATRRAGLLAVLMACASSVTQAQAVDYPAFRGSPLELRGHAWFTFNLGMIDEDSIRGMMDRAVRTGSYGGFMITPSPASRGRQGGALAPDREGVAYLVDEYFRLYRFAIDLGLKNELPMDVLYDELQFPTGMAGGLFYEKYPELAEKSLEKTEMDVAGPASVELSIPAANSRYIGAALLNLDTLETEDVTAALERRGTHFSGRVPAGRWKLMLFWLDTSRRRGAVDYLSAEAVDGLIDVMYDRYYEKLGDYFGSVIHQIFYDEPSMHNGVSGRLWTPDFNPAFEARYGYSPIKYYPALWYDIGPDTAAARNALFGFRADMYADNFIGRVAAWADAHGVALSGHLDQEEAPNPVGTQGDLMKVFRHQQIPTVDDIWFTGRSNTSYKIVSSAAFNYDRPIIAAETYAAYQQPWQNETAVWRTAMDQHAMGINEQIGNRPDGGATPEMGDYVGRLEYLLRGGRHVADIAVLYPIASLQASYHFAEPAAVEPVTGGGARRGDPGFYYALEGGTVQPENDYMALGEMLFRGMRIDYTYLHPDILENNCLIEDGRLIIDNTVNREAFRVLIVPGSRTITLATARKIKAFYDAGGTVIATEVLPDASADFGQDAEVRRIMGDVFGIYDHAPMTATIRAFTDDFKTFFAHVDPNRGKAYFLPRPDRKMVDAVLTEALPVRDVNVQMKPTWPVKLNRDYDGALTYIHKVRDGRDIYFFANSTDAAIDAPVTLRGDQHLERWDPHTGERSQPMPSLSEAAGEPVTSLQLELGPLKSVFYVETN